MGTPSDDEVGRSARLNVPVLLALTAAGLAANFLHYEIFFSIQFLFGSLFSLLALQLFGLVPGVLAGAVASTATYFVWNHPYAIVILTAEVLAVGVLRRWRHTELVIADAVYWFVLGMPLVYLFYRVVMGLPPSNATITMFKQALNGIANALVARLVFLAGTAVLGRRPASLREVVFNLLAVFALAPALILLAVQSKSELASTDQAVRESLALASARVSASLESWLRHRSAQVSRIAEIAATRPVADVQHSIEQAMTMGEGFLRMGLLDRGATIVAYWPLVDELGQPNLGKNFSDRPFIPVLRRTLRPLLSEVVLGRIGVPRPMVTALAPVVAGGQYAGYVSGILSLDGLAELVALNARGQALPGLVQSVVDRNGKIIVTSRPDSMVMAPFARAEGEIRDLGGGISQWVPFSRKNVSVSERWRRSVYIAEREVGPTSEWKLILEQPVGPFQSKLYGAYAGKMALILAILVAALPLAELLSRKVVSSLSLLEAATANIPSQVQSGQATVWPRVGLRETERLTENFKSVTEALTRQFEQMRGLNAALEERVDERTRELRESEEKYRILFENEIYAICIFDLETLRFLDVNRAYERIYGYSRQELLGGMTVHDITAEPDEFGQAAREAVERGTIFVPLRYHRKKDGATFPVEIVGGPYTWKGRKVMFALAHDISERQAAEERVRSLLREQETILSSAPVGIWLVAGRRIVWTNPAQERLFGIAASDSAGIETRSFYADLEAYERVGSDGYAALERGETFSRELKMRRRNGEVFWCALSGRAIDPNRPREGSIWVLRDVSELRQARALLQSILDSAPVSIGWTDQMGTMAYVNARFEEEIGYRIEDIPTLEAWFERAYPDPAYREERAQTWEHLRLAAAAEGRSTFGPMEAWIHCGDGRRRCFAVYGGSLPTAHVAIFSDVTERKETEQRLHDYAETQRVLLREVNHRVKNNLSAIIGVIYLEADRADTRGSLQVAAILRDMEARVRSLAAVHSLLSSSEWRPIRLSDLCSRILSGILPSTGSGNTRIRVGDAPLLVDARQAHDLALVLNELATNTLKHGANSGEPNVEVDMEEAGGIVSLAYRDFGPGFPAEVLAEAPGADGVGLTLIRGVVRQSLRGTLELSNREGALAAIRFPKIALEGVDGVS